MSDLADLLVAVSTLASALAGAFALVWTTVRSGRDGRRAADQASRDAVAAILAAMDDGEITPDDVRDIRAALGDDGSVTDDGS